MVPEPEVVPPSSQHESRVVYGFNDLLRGHVDIAPDRGLAACLNAHATSGFQRLQKHLRVGLIEVPPRLPRHLSEPGLCPALPHYEDWAHRVLP
jgi:hypothetical protein